jgi:hypothetical protein
VLHGSALLGLLSASWSEPPRRSGLWLALRLRSADVRAVNTMKLTIERRVNEIIAEAGDQLGSDTASIRLTGLYALERWPESPESSSATQPADSVGADV